MSYLRRVEPLTYFGGKSDTYLYPAGENRVSGDVKMREDVLAEVALRVIERTDLDDETFDEVVEAVTAHYPEDFEKPASAPEMAGWLEKWGNMEWSEDEAIESLDNMGYEDAPYVKKVVAYELWQEDK